MRARCMQKHYEWYVCMHGGACSALAVAVMPSLRVIVSKMHLALLTAHSEGGGIYATKQGDPNHVTS